MRYLYTLYDAKTGELAHKGTPAQLIADGVFNSSEEAARAWGRQHLNGIAPRKWRVEREKVERMVPLSAYKRREKYSEPKNGLVVKKSCPIDEPDALQKDVHELCYYNAVARQRGKKELSYGHWALAGKPEEPL